MRTLDDWTFVKIAGAWGHGPLDSDSAGDLIDSVEDEGHSPYVGLYVWLSSLEDQDPSNVWAAIGVWDAVVSSPYEEWLEQFLPMAEKVRDAAQDILHDDEWMDEWRDPAELRNLVEIYASGGRVGFPGRFNPRGAWVPVEATAWRRGPDIDLFVRMRNEATDDTLLAELHRIQGPLLPVEEVEAHVDCPGWKLTVVLVARDDGPAEFPLVSVVKIDSFDGQTGFASVQQEPWRRADATTMETYDLG